MSIRFVSACFQFKSTFVNHPNSVFSRRMPGGANLSDYSLQPESEKSEHYWSGVWSTKNNMCPARDLSPLTKDILLHPDSFVTASFTLLTLDTALFLRRVVLCRTLKKKGGRLGAKYAVYVCTFQICIDVQIEWEKRKLRIKRGGFVSLCWSPWRNRRLSTRTELRRSSFAASLTKNSNLLGGLAEAGIQLDFRWTWTGRVRTRRREITQLEKEARWRGAPRATICE